MIYGSYLAKESSITEVTSVVAFADTFVAILAGIIIFPMVFTFNLDPSSAGPGLIFQTLPLAFGVMPYGEIVATLFFVLLFFAAITSSISLIEPAISFLIEQYSFSRAEATVRLSSLTWFIGLGTLLSFNYISDITFFGMTFFDLLDSFTSKVMLPLGGLLMAIFVGFIVKRKIVIDELDMNLYLSARNIPNVDVITVKEINPVNLIKSHKVAVTSEALKQIEEWINV